MTPAELATILESYAARHAADSALWERVLPEAAKALRVVPYLTEEDKEAIAARITAETGHEVKVTGVRVSHTAEIEIVGCKGTVLYKLP